MEQPLAQLPSLCSRTLQALYDRQAQTGEDGKLHSIDATTRISPDEGLELLRLAREVNACSLLEVGLAYGFSTQFLLSALVPQGGRLLALDPFQSSDWHGIGRCLAEKTVAALTSDPASCGPLQFHWIQEPSHRALPTLEAAGESFDLIFIDGYHRFDDVLIDVSLASRLCRQGGVIVLHDLWLPAVRSVVAFLETNRSDLARLETACPNLGVFQVQGRDQRNWDHFVPFASASEPWLEET
ncbi:MAG: class I SAM-dependent methyltransferase [Cyanobium usitatum Tobar12.5m-G36]|nr:class I SAM-dependent methyltransferase [Cyanobium usitatum Tobar12.5m-G36]